VTAGRKSSETATGKKLDPELQAQLDRLGALPEDEIDAFDIPEAPAENWERARRPATRRIR